MAQSTGAYVITLRVDGPAWRTEISQNESELLYTYARAYKHHDRLSRELIGDIGQVSVLHGSTVFHEFSQRRHSPCV